MSGAKDGAAIGGALRFPKNCLCVFDLRISRVRKRERVSGARDRGDTMQGAEDDDDSAFDSPYPAVVDSL